MINETQKIWEWEMVSQNAEISEPVTQMVTGCCKNDKTCNIWNMGQKRFTVKYEEYGDIL